MDTGGFAPALSYVWHLANSNFALALVSALAGSFAGAYGAQWIAQREGQKGRALAQLRATNVATSQALFVFNASTALKRQHVRPMVAKYRAAQKGFVEAISTPNHWPPQTFQFTADWQTLPFTQLPIDALTDTIFGRIDISSPAITLVTMLKGVAANLESVVMQRTQLIEEVRKGPQLTAEEVTQLYFGAATPAGTTDRRYQGLIDAIEHYTDAAILFSAVLVEQLIGHGEATAKEFGKSAPRVVRADLRPAFTQSLVPDPAEYADTLKAIGIDPETTLSQHRG